MHNPTKPYFLVIDFEANCSSSKKRDHEIIEFPAVLCDAKTMTVVDEFHTYVKMLTHKNLSEFIKDLTHITDEQVNGGKKWGTVLRDFEDWCRNHELTSDNCTVMTCGDWDLKTMLPKQLKGSMTRLTPYVTKLLGCWNNVKIAFAIGKGNQGLRGMAAMLTDLNITLTGHHHSGIDDSRNIAKIAFCMLKDFNVDVTLPNKCLDFPYYYDRVGKTRPLPYSLQEIDGETVIQENKDYFI